MTGCRKLLLPIILLFLTSCASGMEVAQAIDERPSVEMAIDRVNTAARALELGDIILRALPVSAASSWPQDLDRVLPKGDQSKLMAIALQDTLFAPGSGFRPSPTRIKVMYMQSALFEMYPDLYYERKYMRTPPTNENINDFGSSVLGRGYDSVFNKSFYRLLRFSPDFIPKKRHYTAKLNGNAVEYFSSLEDAVISLADNADQLRRIRNDMMETDEQKKRSIRDINDVGRMIKELKDKGEKQNREEIASLENEIRTHRKEYDEAAAKYAELLKSWKSELAGIRKQATAFNDEQMFLAGNIQAAVNVSKGIYGDSLTLVALAAVKLPSSLAHLPDEINRLMTSPAASIRIMRIYLNLAALPDNASIIKNELGQLYEEANAMDGLFDGRVKAKIVNKTTNRM